MTTTTPILSAGETRLERRSRLLNLHLSRPTIALGLIFLLAVALRFANLDAIGTANSYYTAAVKSMLLSWKNFFFVAAEPGGSVTVDKPPLGLWLQAISAMIFGVTGFAVVLPQLLAGVLAVPVLYHLVKRYFGAAAGLIAALALAVTPVAIAAERNNTMDATLIFTLLLAAWAFIKATDSGKLRWLLLGGVLIGVGFNIKMLQAFLPVPAFFALYFFGAKLGWKRKMVTLALTTVVMLVVSLSWAVVVDLTPADQRPYIGSSTNNTVMELIIGHNGLDRIAGQVNPTSADAAGTDTAGTAAVAGATSGQAGSFTPPSGGFPPGQRDGAPPNGGTGGGAFVDEIGTAGIFRLFTTPLANEISWLLPFGLFSVILVGVSSRLRRLPLSDDHQAVILWGGWLLTEVVFFSVAGFFHAYYLAMLAPPLAALVGIGIVKLWRLRENHETLAAGLLILTGAGTVMFQAWVANQYVTSAWWAVPGLALVTSGLALLALGKLKTSRRAITLGFAAMLCAMLVIPAAWSGMTTASDQSAALPHAYSGNTAQNFGRPGGVSVPGGGHRHEHRTADLSGSSHPGHELSGGRFQRQGRRRLDPGNRAACAADGRLLRHRPGGERQRFAAACG